MLENIKNIIPKMDESDEEKIYQNLVKRKSTRKTSFNVFKNKFVIAMASFVVLLAVFIPVGIHLYDKGGNNPAPDIWEEGPGVGDITDVEDVVNLGNGVATLQFVDCYHGDSVDVLSVLVSGIGAQDLYIKSTDIDNQIVDVQVKGYDDKVSYQNPAYVIDVKDMRYIYVDIHFMEGTLEKNLVSSDDDKNYNDKDHVSQKTNVTYLKFMISVFDLSGGYEEVEYVANYDYIDDEPSFLIVGLAQTLEEAMMNVEMPALLAFNDVDPFTITYQKTNKKTEIFYGYGANRTIGITALILDTPHTLNSIANEFIDTDLYKYQDTGDVTVNENESIVVDYYLCYKNEEGMKLGYAITSLEIDDKTCYYIISFDLNGENANYELKHIINEMNFIYK